MAQPGQAPIHLQLRRQVPNVQTGQPHERMDPAWEQWFQNTQMQFNTYRKVIQPTVGASPFTFQYLGVSVSQQGPCLAVINGGTVSKVEISRDGVTYFQVGAATNMAVPLSFADFIRITYTAAPTLTLFPQ